MGQRSGQRRPPFAPAWAALKTLLAVAIAVGFVPGARGAAGAKGDAVFEIRGTFRGCDGDCNGDLRVGIDELTRGVAIALERMDAASCPAFVAPVTVALLVRAVRAALDGCPLPANLTPTATPSSVRPVVFTPTPARAVPVTESGVDLFPSRLTLARCGGEECLTVPFLSGTVCVGNQGAADAGEFVVDVDDAVEVQLDGLASGQERCFDLPQVSSATVTVDVDDRIVESREDNNSRSFPAPGPTACDVIRPPCTPTPPTSALDSCEECCAHCSDDECRGRCFGVEPCELRTEWRGRVTDASTGEPIAGAEVTVNGTQVTTDQSGAYAVLSAKAEICNGLDYLYEFSVRAAGYRSFTSSVYQSLISGLQMRDVELTAGQQCGDPAVTQQFARCKESQTEADCLSAGGTWITYPYSRRKGCLCPTGQGGCRCSGPSDCVGRCFAPLAIDLCDSLQQGTCSAAEPEAGCWCQFTHEGRSSPFCNDP